MRTAVCALIFGLALLQTGCADLAAQPKVAVTAAAIPSPSTTKSGGDAPFDQRKADVETIKSAGLSDDTKSLTEWFKNHTVTEADKTKITTLIKRLGDDDFDSREAASDELSKSGVPAIALLRSAANAKDADYEVARRCNLALAIIEKVPTRSLALAAARLLANQKDESITEVLLNYLPLADDESVADEIRNTFAALAVRDAKPDKALGAALESKDALKRGAAAEAFARANDRSSRQRMKELLKKETDPEVKLLVALALVSEGRDKDAVPEVIKLMPDVSTERGWRAEELLYRIAGEDGPGVSLGPDKAGREKARDEWKKWWDANEKKVDLTKLDQESSFGLTIVCELQQRGQQIGRVVALGSDGKERWSVKGLNTPLDAVPLAGKKVLIAEHNRNRIVEREIDGKEIWSENIQQPVNVGRLPNGITWAVGKNQIIEWERGDKPGKKQVFTFIRNEYDIVAGARLKSGDYVLLTQNQQLLKVDRKGTITKSHGVGGSGVNYYATVDPLPSGKVLVTLMNSITEYDLESGKSGWSANFQIPTSAVRLRNGNTLVGNMNNWRIVELDKDGKQTKWEYRGTDPAYKPFRAFKR
ncbi:MAG TPA: hypothetical protein VKE40_19665 [Gemmataceae bacterium]|nr:hypothetical protein [Gemmataceae bacterium]